MAAAQDLTAAADQHGNPNDQDSGCAAAVFLPSGVGIPLGWFTVVLCHSSPLRGSDKPATVKSARPEPPAGVAA